MSQAVGYIIKNKKDFEKFYSQHKHVFWTKTLYQIKLSDWDNIFQTYGGNNVLNKVGLTSSIKPMVIVKKGFDISITPLEVAKKLDIELIKL